MNDVINRTCETCEYGDPMGLSACGNADSPYCGMWSPFDICNKWEERPWYDLRFFGRRAKQPVNEQRQHVMSNSEWVTLIASDFEVSRSTAKEMLHAMYAVKKNKNITALQDTQHAKLVQVDSLDETERGDNGFGSSGR